MRKRVFSILLHCGPLLVVSAGCGKTGMMHAPTRVVAEEAEEPSPLLVRASSAEQDPPSTVDRKDAPPVPEAGAFHFPADKGGELLSKQLTPSTTRPLPEADAHPRRFRTSAHLEAPELPLPPSLAIHPALAPERSSKYPLPRMVTPETLVALALEVALPLSQPMAVGQRTKEAGANVNEPAPLPILGQQIPDRAALTDATGDASGAAVLSATMPVRRQSVPFQRLSVPDPYENYRPLRLPIPAESTAPITAAPRTPQP